nr:PREDICTED: uncharacterized protein LOC106705434 [Latimeria chalumnae]|eukprot:XP_014350365.1 PREDICTED: uncharacterized protein LOC106705434 [Latimeria chalumnae]
MILWPGKCQILDIRYMGVELRLINVYGPQTRAGRRKLWSMIKPMLFTQKLVILGGDYNNIAVLKDRAKERKSLTYEETFLNRSVEQALLVEVYAKLFPEAKGHTYTKGLVASRIDRIYLSKLLNPLGTSFEPVVFDHAGLTVVLGTPGSPSYGKGIWRNNISMYKNEMVISQIKRVLSDSITKLVLYDKINDWWEDTKREIKATLQFLSKRFKRKLFTDHNKANLRLARLFTAVNNGDEVKKQEFLNSKKDL